jgi:hypothetical protein
VVDKEGRRLRAVGTRKGAERDEVEKVTQALKASKTRINLYHTWFIILKVSYFSDKNRRRKKEKGTIKKRKKKRKKRKKRKK